MTLVQDRAKRALSISLLTFPAIAPGRLKMQNTAKRTKNKHQLWKNHKLTGTCVDSKYTSTCYRSNLMSSVDFTYKFSIQPSFSFPKLPKSMKTREKPQADSHMCRFQIHHRQLQVAIDELYGFMIFFAHPLLFFSRETEENHQESLKSKKILNCFSHVSTVSSSSLVPSQTSRVVSIQDIIRLSSSFLLSKTAKNHQKSLQIKESRQLSLTCVHFKFTGTNSGSNLSRVIDL